MSIHRFEPRPDDLVDEQEWQLQERALREERDGAPAGEDPALAQYRQVARALRAPPPVALPADFAAGVASRAAARAQADGRFEQVLTQLLLAALAFAGVAAAMVWGGEWWRASSTLLPSPQRLGLAVPWGLAIAACLGLSWATEQLRRRGPLHH
ncbi:MAG TPA: hypothetical protein VLM17_07620 [Xanthomonadaceae bacterium]|nr:hypothetical protein [Xanthomonadaceae bacterium]